MLCPYAVMMPSKKIICFLVLTGILSICGCDIITPPEKKVVISVGDQTLQLEGLRVEIKRLGQEMEIDAQGLKQVIESLVDTVVDRMLVLEYAREKGIFVSDKELASMAADIRKDYSEAEFKELLLERYIDYHGWQEGLRRQLLVKKTMASLSRNITPVASGEIKAYYDAHKEEFDRPQMIKFIQIVVETKKDAEDVQKRLSTGEDMAQLAREASIVPFLENENQLAWIARGNLEESMEKALFSLPAGKIGPIIKTPYGFHIFKVLSKRPGGHVSLPDATEEIESRLLYEKQQALYLEWLKELKNRYPVFINRELIQTLEWE